MTKPKKVRKKPRKPASLEDFPAMYARIRDHNGSASVSVSANWGYPISAKKARRLANWLIRFAEWDEAQEKP